MPVPGRRCSFGSEPDSQTQQVPGTEMVPEGHRTQQAGAHGESKGMKGQKGVHFPSSPGPLGGAGAWQTHRVAWTCPNPEGPLHPTCSALLKSLVMLVVPGCPPPALGIADPPPSLLVACLPLALLAAPDAPQVPPPTPLLLGAHPAAPPLPSLRHCHSQLGPGTVLSRPADGEQPLWAPQCLCAGVG